MEARHAPAGAFRAAVCGLQRDRGTWASGTGRKFPHDLVADAFESARQPLGDPLGITPVEVVAAGITTFHSVAEDVVRDGQDLVRHGHSRTLHPAPRGDAIEHGGEIAWKSRRVVKQYCTPPTPGTDRRAAAAFTGTTAGGWHATNLPANPNGFQCMRMAGSTMPTEKMYASTITVTDTLDGQSDSKTSSINISDPSVNASGGFTFQVNVGTNTGPQAMATFTDPAGAEPNASDSAPPDSSGHYTASIDWGDGTKSKGVITPLTPSTPTQQFIVTGNHTYTTGSPVSDFNVITTIDHEGVTSVATSTAMSVEPARSPAAEISATAAVSALTLSRIATTPSKAT